VRVVLGYRRAADIASAAWVERVLQAGATAMPRGVALTFQVQLGMMAGSRQWMRRRDSRQKHCGPPGWNGSTRSVFAEGLLSP